jgi:hypothetical protein
VAVNCGMFNGRTAKDRLAYHFVNLENGLDDIRRRRLKIAIISELNDPFEFGCINLSDPKLRRALPPVKDALSAISGLLCFSGGWRNPLMWSHYAERHTGICLGFDIPDSQARKVIYSTKRVRVETARLLNPEQIDQCTRDKLLLTKFSHWRYEDERRCFLSLADIDKSSGLYFAEFSQILALRRVIVGAASTLSKADLLNALGDLSSTVEVFKSRLAFGSFRIVRQNNKALWP